MTSVTKPVYKHFTKEEFDKVFNEVYKEIMPQDWIIYLGDGWYQIGIDDFIVITREAGVIEFDKTLKEAAKKYEFGKNNN